MKGSYGKLLFLNQKIFWKTDEKDRGAAATVSLVCGKKKKST